MPLLTGLLRTSAEDARQFAYRILKLSILELLLRPGVKLNEAKIASSLQMSRTPVHDVFGRLARENLVEQIPQRGAFVARIHPEHACHAVWMLVQTGTAVLEKLYTEHAQTVALEPLRQNLARQQLCIATQDTAQAARTVIEFHRILYGLAHLELVWESLQCACADFRRLAQLCSTQAGCCESTLLECKCMIEALAARDHATACRALQHQFMRLYAMMPKLQKGQPELFEPAAERI